MDVGESIIKKGHVVSVDDSTDGLRIKVRLDIDDRTPIDELPYSFPLLPKTFQSVPKVGEGAFVITTMSAGKESQRYYLGPIISQPQYMNMCSYENGRGPAMNNIKGGLIGPLEKISNYKETFGAFPETNDVAMVGRGSQDIVMKNNESLTSNELDIRCGIRKKSMYDKVIDSSLIGNVIFNNTDPAYIQLKYKKNITKEQNQEANSVINLVADKINVISNQDENGLSLTDPDTLIKEEDLDNIMSKLHQLPHGDTLVDLLRKIIMAILTHVHPYAGMPTCINGYTEEIASYDLDKILSKHVRIS